MYRKHTSYPRWYLITHRHETVIFTVHGIWINQTSLSTKTQEKSQTKKSHLNHTNLMLHSVQCYIYLTRTRLIFALMSYQGGIWAARVPFIFSEVPLWCDLGQKQTHTLCLRGLSFFVCVVKLVIIMQRWIKCPACWNVVILTDLRWNWQSETKQCNAKCQCTTERYTDSNMKVTD